MIECACDCDNYVELAERLVISVGTEFCVECRRLIPQGERHYFVWQWTFNENGDETHLGEHRCCEECGDLAVSYLQLGYCWSFGCIRDDIEEINRP